MQSKKGAGKPAGAADLRARAEQRLAKACGDVPTTLAEEAQKLLYELQVHQIELELQNEELREIQLELEASRDSYRDLYDFAPVGYLTLDPEGVILEANLAAAKLLDLERQKLLRQKLSHFVHLSDEDTLYFHRNQVFSTGAKQTCELRIRAPGDTVRHARLESVAVEAEDGTRNRCRMALIHITERERAEEALQRAHELEQRVRERTAELEASNAELERFAYTVSHDLRTPLVTIMGFLGELEQDAVAGNAQRIAEDLSFISGAADRMCQLLDGILELCRTGHAANPPEDVPVAELVRETVELSKESIAGRGVEVEIGPDLPVVHGDRIGLLELLQNLLDNALKFMGDQPRPRIEIGARQDGDQKVCYVRDNGIGIDPQYHEGVFGLFNRLDPKREGTGVGLAVARRIIEVHGGRIWVESDGLGRGSSFCFTIPEARKALEPARPGP